MAGDCDARSSSSSQWMEIVMHVLLLLLPCTVVSNFNIMKTLTLSAVYAWLREWGVASNMGGEDKSIVERSVK